MKEEKAQIIEEKDLIIQDLQFRIDNMESSYENILHVSFQKVDQVVQPLHCCDNC